MMTVIRYWNEQNNSLLVNFNILLIKKSLIKTQNAQIQLKFLIELKTQEPELIWMEKSLPECILIRIQFIWFIQWNLIHRMMIWIGLTFDNWFLCIRWIIFRSTGFPSNLILIHLFKIIRFMCSAYMWMWCVSFCEIQRKQQNNWKINMTKKKERTREKNKKKEI